MARQHKDIEGIAQELKFTRHQIYWLVRRPHDPLPHGKIGKHLRFDVKKVDRWFNRQLGRDGDDLNIGVFQEVRNG